MIAIVYFYNKAIALKYCEKALLLHLNSEFIQVFEYTIYSISYNYKIVKPVFTRNQ